MDNFRIYAYMIPLASIVPLIVTFLSLRILPRLSVKKVETGEKSLRAELGGLAIAGGLILGILSSIGFISYSSVSLPRLPFLGAAITLVLISLISVIDDFYLSLHQQLKPVTLLLAGLFMAFIEAGGLTGSPVVQTSTVAALPLILIPIGVAGASYLVNRLEAVGDLGMGTVAIVSLGILAFLRGEHSALLVLASGFGISLAALYRGFSKPSKKLIGDVGTYSIGTLIASSAIIGGLELAAVIVLIPYLLNFGLKMSSRSLGQLLGGLSVRAMALALMGIEAIFGLVAILTYTTF
jgi:UDP-N-acetylglucosamine--dolichyl-phosphate N-acetylglucosaminephosphotransferase